MHALRTTAAVAGMSTLTLAAVAGTADPVAFEVSADGRARTELPAGSAVSFGSAAETSTLPFGTEPDQEVTLRRQIGGLKVADMNNDGFNDVVAVCYISNSFPPYDDWRDQIYFGTGSGIETTPGWLSSIQTHSGDVQVGDVNGDGVDDAVVVHGGGVRGDHVRVYYGADGAMPSTDAAFTSTFGQGGWGTSGVLFDIDGDDDLDLFVTNQGIDPQPFRPMTLYRNLGSGFATAPSWISAEQSIQGGASAGDVDGDGMPDIGVSRWANFEAGILKNMNGTPVETPPLFSIGTSGTDRGSAIGDIDGDGRNDFGVGGSEGPRVWLNGSDGFPPANPPLPPQPSYVGNPPFSGPQEFGFFDADGDGDLDLAEIHFSDGRAHIYQNNDGRLDVTPTWTYDAPEVGSSLAFGDLNGDGVDDLVLGYAGNTSIRVFLTAAADCPADLADPFGFLDLSDVDAFIGAFQMSDPIADLVEPFGFFDLSDVDAFIGSFLAGCP